MNYNRDFEIVKKAIGAIVATPGLRIQQLCSRYEKVANEKIPYSKFGFCSVFQLLQEIPDVVKILDPTDQNSYVRAAVINVKTSYCSNPTQKRRIRLRSIFKNDLHRFLLQYPTGMEYEMYDCYVQQLCFHHRLNMQTEEVLEFTSEFTFFANGKVFALPLKPHIRLESDEEEESETGPSTSGYKTEQKKH